MGDQRNADGRSRVTVRLSPDERERAEYWAAKRGFSSLNEYVANAVSEQVRREMYDFDIPEILVSRMNQLIDETKSLSTNVANLERVSTMGFDSLIGVTKGGNYLLDQPEDGEL